MAARLLPAALRKRLIAGGAVLRPLRSDQVAPMLAWVEPRVVCEVRFLEQTDDGLLRQPVFVRFRPDKTPSDCYARLKGQSP
jgi:bifunctional non-homologous end joining protein LigD